MRFTWRIYAARWPVIDDALHAYFRLFLPPIYQQDDQPLHCHFDGALLRTFRR